MIERTLWCWLAVLGAAFWGCSPGPQPEQREEQASEPEIPASLFLRPPAVERNPNDDAPLAALVDIATHTDVVPEIEIDDGDRQWSYRPAVEPATEHRLVVLGLRPDRTQELRVRVQGTDGQEEVSEPFAVTTPPLPDDFPPLEVLVSQPAAMEPGVTVFPVNLWVDSTRAVDYGYLIALDAEGHVVWYLRTRHRTAAFQILENGHLLVNHALFHSLYEFEPLGSLVREWYAANLNDPPSEAAIPVACDTFHHEILVLPSGNMLTLSTGLRWHVLPGSETDPAAPVEPALVVGDVIVEFRPDDGAIVEQWHLFDMLDADRIGYGSLSPFWRPQYERFINSETHDWSHANGLVYVPQQDAMLVSVRHQDCVVKIDRGSGQLRWILGDPDGWAEPWRPLLLRPVGELEWFYHPHAPAVTPRGTLMLYDNGNYRARPFEPRVPAEENYSRVVEYAIDEAAGTVRQVWEYRGEEGEQFYCPYYGDGLWLPQTGNVLVTNGGHIETAEGIPLDQPPGERQWSLIREVTRTDPPETVFEVVIDSGIDSPYGWSVYRSRRLPSLEHLVPPSRR
jgi:arylsulfate sulfotransferase